MRSVRSTPAAVQAAERVGAPAVLHVFASWCAACRWELPALMQFETEEQIPETYLDLWDELRASQLVKIESAAHWNMNSKRMEADSFAVDRDWPRLLQMATQWLAPGGYLHCATDWEPYAQQMLQVLSAEPQLRNSAEGYAPRPSYRPLTKFENRGLRLGHGVWDVVFERRA